MKCRSMTLWSIGLTAMLGMSVAAVAQQAQDKPAPTGHQHTMERMGHGMANMSEGSKELHRAMKQGMNMPMQMTGDVDTDFATMMTMHHKQAIRMSEALLKHGKNPELRALAEKMQASQREEIEKMAPYAKPR